MPQPFSDEKKLLVTRKVFALYTKYGFNDVSMDELAAKTHVSKATIYKYYKSKEDIVEGLVDTICLILDSTAYSTENGIDSVLESFSDIYTKGVLASVYSGKEFMSDLDKKFPELSDKVESSVGNYVNRFLDFYKQTVSEGYCRRFAVPLVGQQLVQMLPKLTDREYLEKNGITVSESVNEYYRMFLHQILSEEYSYVIGQDSIFEFTKNLVSYIDEFFDIEVD